jgi:prophage DNA circulation protein
MAQTWADFLQPCSFGGVAFEIISIDDNATFEVDEQTFPHRSRAHQEGRGENAEEFSVEAVFIDDDYPDVMNELLDKIRENKPQELVHPVRGQMQAMCIAARTHHSAEDGVDAARMQLTMRRHDPAVADVFRVTNTLPARANAVRAAADDVKISADALKESLA